VNPACVRWALADCMPAEEFASASRFDELEHDHRMHEVEFAVELQKGIVGAHEPHVLRGAA
jgi:hypothetical protein